MLAAGAAGAVFVRAQKDPAGSGCFRLVLQLPPQGTVKAQQLSWWHVCYSVFTKKKKSKDAGEEVWSEVKSVRNSSVTIRVRAAEEQRFSHRLWRAHATEGAPGRNGSSGRAVLEQEKRVRRRRETVTQ